LIDRAVVLALNKALSDLFFDETVGNHFIAGRQRDRSMEISSEQEIKSTQKIKSKKGGLRTMPFIIGEVLLLLIDA